MNLSRLSLFAFAALLAAQAGAQTGTYRVRAKDSLSIAVMNEPTLSREALVTDDGSIAYPYVGTFKVEGLTVDEISQRIAEALRRYYVKPEVTVAVTKSRPLTASGVGAFAHPGSVEIQPDSRLLNLVVQCGGLPEAMRPDWVRGTLIRRGKTIEVDFAALMLGTGDQNIPVQDGDILLLQAVEDSLRSVKIIGEVSRPGSIPASHDLSFPAALAEVGGTTPHAALAQAIVMRKGKAIPIDLRNLLVDGAVPDNMTLMAGDTLVIPTNRKRFSILGAVRSPGVFDYPETAPLDLLSALALAGGQATEADLKAIYIVKSPAPGATYDPNSATKVDVTKLLSKGEGRSVVLEPGDVVYVSTRKNPTRPSDLLSYLNPFLFFLRP